MSAQRTRSKRATDFFARRVGTDAVGTIALLGVLVLVWLEWSAGHLELTERWSLRRRPSLEELAPILGLSALIFRRSNGVCLAAMACALVPIGHHAFSIWSYETSYHLKIAWDGLLMGALMGMAMGQLVAGSRHPAVAGRRHRASALVGIVTAASAFFDAMWLYDGPWTDWFQAQDDRTRLYAFTLIAPRVVGGVLVVFSSTEANAWHRLWLCATAALATLASTIWATGVVVSPWWWFDVTPDWDRWTPGAGLVAGRLVTYLAPLLITAICAYELATRYGGLTSDEPSTQPTEPTPSP